MAKKVTTRLNKQELAKRIRSLPAILSGALPDQTGIASGFYARMASEFFNLATDDFDVKANGGVGAGQIQWKPLKPASLLSRKNKPAALRGSAVQKNQQASQLYRSVLAREAARRSAPAAQQIAANYAKSRRPTKRQTALAIAAGLVPGADYEILKDTGDLARSLQPGILAESDIRATYTPPENQVVKINAGSVTLGTSIEYASRQHKGGGNVPARPFWPDRLPLAWRKQIAKVATAGLTNIGDKISR